MRLGILSDIHGNSEALRASLRVLTPRVDAFIFLGDLSGYYPFAHECLEMMQGLPMLAQLLGNHDEILRRCFELGEAPAAEYVKKYGPALTRSWSRKDPMVMAWVGEHEASARIHVHGYDILLSHGTPWDPLVGRVYPDFNEWERFEELGADVILMGHTHYAFERRCGEVLVVNPGAIGQPRDRSFGASMAVLELDASGCQVEHLRVPYDKTRVLEDARLHAPDHHYLTKVLTR